MTHSMPAHENTDSPQCQHDQQALQDAMSKSWAKIAPFWPLKNLVAVNPLAGFESIPFEKALEESHRFFQRKDLPDSVRKLNRESIKWLQVYFDQGQAKIPMPYRSQGLLSSILRLLPLDQTLHHGDSKNIQWIKSLPKDAESVISECLTHLSIPGEKLELFLTLLLTTLPGWARYVQYRAHWCDAQDQDLDNTACTREYLAFRLVLACLCELNAKTFFSWHKMAMGEEKTKDTYEALIKAEKTYQKELLEKLEHESENLTAEKPAVQMVFCIDVRSEPFRQALEHQGSYETFGFAGFFAIPSTIEDAITKESYASCPVLLKPAHTVTQTPGKSLRSQQKRYQRWRGVRALYNSLKYTFTTPFSLVDLLGIFSGLWIACKNFFPRFAQSLKSTGFQPNTQTRDVLQTHDIPLEKQVEYALGALTVMGIAPEFSPLVVFCGHTSLSQNNAYASFLDCGACGGRRGGPNARLLAKVLNDKAVRDALLTHGIQIPHDTFFMAAEHNTTTDVVEVYDEDCPASHQERLQRLKLDLEQARIQNNLYRQHHLEKQGVPEDALSSLEERSLDWAQVRPEWGLAKNASMLIAPRQWTRGVDLEGRSFLHSYHWERDPEGSSLSAILTAPMVVAQWINSQYLFSTLDNVAYGAGSKITNTVTGKIGTMQGNASDLMHGLPLQSVYESDLQAYHQPVRLTVLVYAPKKRILRSIKAHAQLRQLFENTWLHLICFDPQDKQKHHLQNDLTWREITD